MRIGSVVAPGPVVKLATTKSSSDSENASIQPAAIAGAISGSVTVRKVLNGGQPRSIAASSRLRSNSMSRESTINLTQQSVTALWAIAEAQNTPSTWSAET